MGGLVRGGSQAFKKRGKPPTSRAKKKKRQGILGTEGLSLRVKGYAKRGREGVP